MKCFSLIVDDRIAPKTGMCGKNIKITAKDLSDTRKSLHKFISNINGLEEPWLLYQAIDNIEYYTLKYELGSSHLERYYQSTSENPEAENEAEVDKDVETITKKLAAIPEYQGSVFQALGDYNKCKEANSNKLCAALFILTIARELIPLAGSR